jgi:nucleotide-binding universal stress UspA family protein
MSYDRVLVPLDGSQLAEYVLPHVQTIAGTYKSDVTLFHAVGGSDERHLTPSQKAARADIAAYLERTSTYLTENGISVDWRVSYGDPVDEILRQSAVGDIDLVMMSTHGEGGRRNGAGSVATAVVSAGLTPVMVVRPPDEVAER